MDQLNFRRSPQFIFYPPTLRQGSLIKKIGGYYCIRGIQILCAIGKRCMRMSFPLVTLSAEDALLERQAKRFQWGLLTAGIIVFFYALFQAG